MAKPFFEARIRARGPGGNIYEIVAAARLLMREIGVERETIDDMTRRAGAAQSYREAIAVVEEWFPVDRDEECADG